MNLLQCFFKEELALKVSVWERKIKDISAKTRTFDRPLTKLVDNRLCLCCSHSLFRLFEDFLPFRILIDFLPLSLFWFPDTRGYFPAQLICDVSNQARLCIFLHSGPLGGVTRSPSQFNRNPPKSFQSEFPLPFSDGGYKLEWGRGWEAKTSINGVPCPPMLASLPPQLLP